MVVLTKITKCEIMPFMSKECLFPNQLRKLRVINNLTQVEVAKAMGIAPGNLSRMEKGKVQITYEKHRALKAKFGWTASMVFGDIDPEVTVPANILLDFKKDIIELLQDARTARIGKNGAVDSKADA